MTTIPKEHGSRPTDFNCIRQ